MSESADIPILRGRCEKDIRKAYYGGNVDVYKPILENGKSYDVNSLFPTAMLGDMPVGTPKYMYKPEIDKFFGYLHIETETPKHIDKPFLQINDEGKNISPVGKIKG